MAPIAKHQAAEVKDFTLEFPFSSICSKKKKKSFTAEAAGNYSKAQWKLGVE